MDKEVSSVINTAIIAFKDGLWPILCIFSLVVFRKQLRALADKFIFAKRIKVNTGLFEIEAIDEKNHNTDEARQIENEKIDSTATPLILEPEQLHWHESVISLLKANKTNEARDVFNNHARENRSHINYEADNAFFLYLLFTNTYDESVLTELLNTIKQSKEIKIRHGYINAYVFCLESAKQFNKAISFLNKEIAETKELKNKAELIVLLSKMHLSGLNPKFAKNEIVSLINILNKYNPEEFENELYSSYLQLAEIENKNDNQIEFSLCLDKALQYNPANTKTLFSAAYQASQAGVLDSITISNYNQLLDLSPRDESAVNNLGVVTEKLNLKIIACNYYRTAKELNNTLAMSNIGYKLLSAGCANEAEDIAKYAITQKNANKNNYELLAKIHTEKDNEEKKWQKIIKESFEQQRLLRNYTSIKYNTEVSIPDIDEWLDSKGRLVTIVLDKNSINFTWADEKRNINFYGSYENASFKGMYISIAKKDTQQLTLLDTLDKTESHQCIGFYDASDDQILIISTSLESNFREVFVKR